MGKQILIMNNTEWQPIETAPKDGTEIIAIEARFPHIIFKCKIDRLKGCDGIISEWCDSDGEVCFPKYWTPIPTLPKQ